MRNTIRIFSVFLLGAMAGISAVLIFGNETDYRQGQIDAINGKYFYQKVRTDSNEVVYIKLTRPVTQPGETYGSN